MTDRRKPATCPECGQVSRLVIGRTQALCTNIDGCRVLTFDPSKDDGGMSEAVSIDLPTQEREA